MTAPARLQVVRCLPQGFNYFLGGRHAGELRLHERWGLDTLVGPRAEQADTHELLAGRVLAATGFEASELRRVAVVNGGPASAPVESECLGLKYLEGSEYLLLIR